MRSAATEKSGWGERLHALWAGAGVEPDKRPDWTAWVRRFGKFIAPKKLYEASQQEVEAFYQRMVSEGRAGWQLEQADEVLRLACQKPHRTE